MTPLFIFPKEMPKLTRILWILVFPVSAIITITIILSILLKSHNSAPPQPLPNVSSSKERATAVRDTFQFAWNGYANYAFPHDELHPVDNAPGTSRNDWGATAIDALGTAILMEIPEVVQMILDFVPSIDFNYTKTRISLFETNIRYLGGMISAYDLLSGPFVGLISNATAKDALLVQSKRLADFLSIAFDTPTGIPENLLHFDGIHIVERRNVSSIADVGTLILEWTRLSDLLHDPKYTKLAQKAEDYTFDPQPAFGEPFPGLIMDQMNTTTGESIQSDGGWGGSSDSYYEYLLKAFIYNETRFSQYKVRWILAANSTMKHLASHPSSRPDLTFLSRYRGPNLTYLSGHMECFAGGNFLLGGTVLKDQSYIDFGLELIKSCHSMYTSTTTGIGPETIRWLPTDCNTNPNSPSCNIPEGRSLADPFYQNHGFWIEDPTYNLRPEALESYYYAYRITRNKKYQDWAWEAFVAINYTARMDYGFNFLGDVNVEGGDKKKGNLQESYFFSETLRYAWLIFKEDGDVHVNGQKGEGQGWVFNTEGHPLRIPT